MIVSLFKPSAHELLSSSGHVITQGVEVNARGSVTVSAVWIYWLRSTWTFLFLDRYYRDGSIHPSDHRLSVYTLHMFLLD